jgi:hypothetical protein
VLQLGRKYWVLIVAILIILPVFIISYPNAASSWQPRVHGDPTPVGEVPNVTATPDCRVIVRLGEFAPAPTYTSCEILLVPPNSGGEDSSGQAKSLKINGQDVEPYNTTITLEVIPSVTYSSLPSGYIKPNDLLVINCSKLGHIPQGRWSIFLMFWEDPMTSATWTVSDNSTGVQSLAFTGPGVGDPMMEYGFVHTPEYGYFWTALFVFSGFALIVMIEVLYSIHRKEKKRKSA